MSEEGQILGMKEVFNTAFPYLTCRYYVALFTLSTIGISNVYV